MEVPDSTDYGGTSIKKREEPTGGVGGRIDRDLIIRGADSRSSVSNVHGIVVGNCRFTRLKAKGTGLLNRCPGLSGMECVCAPLPALVVGDGPGLRPPRSPVS